MRMKLDYKFGIIVVILLTIGAAVPGYYRDKAVEVFISALDTAGLEVLQGRIESPSVIIDVYSVEEFISKVEEHNQSTVYVDGPRYYVFNEDMTIAWEYFFQWEIWIGGEM